MYMSYICPLQADGLELGYNVGSSKLSFFPGRGGMAVSCIYWTNFKIHLYSLTQTLRNISWPSNVNPWKDMWDLFSRRVVLTWLWSVKGRPWPVLSDKIYLQDGGELIYEYVICMRKCYGHDKFSTKSCHIYMCSSPVNMKSGFWNALYMYVHVANTWKSGLDTCSNACDLIIEIVRLNKDLNVLDNCS
jgi:hypothetical protein